MHGHVVTCLGANLLRCVAPNHHDAFRTAVAPSAALSLAHVRAEPIIRSRVRRARRRGGHAGTEAAVAAARRGARTAIITSALETIGQMSCNPAIGGVAKGTVVREVDALGGIMGRATDLATLQFRMLNRGKGPAVWAPRAQCDRGLYRRAVRTLLEAHAYASHDPGNGGAPAVRRRRRRRRGRDARGSPLRRACRRDHDGHVPPRSHPHRHRPPRSRAAAPARPRRLTSPSSSSAPASRWRGSRRERRRASTGGRCDWDALERQESEIEQFDYSWSHFWPDAAPLGGRRDTPSRAASLLDHLPRRRGQGAHRRRTSASRRCTAARSRREVRATARRSRTRSCKFPDAERHQLFLEPEGHDTSELYVNGLSTSLPAPVQLAILRSIPGLETAAMTRAGYAIEYDYYPAHSARRDAAACAPFPGCISRDRSTAPRATRRRRGRGWSPDATPRRPFWASRALVLGRESSYIGVLVDDLVTRGVDEPYRLFTSRSEFRLTVRQDNALRRLAPIGLALGALRRRASVRSSRAASLPRTRHDGSAEATSIRPEQAASVLDRGGQLAAPAQRAHRRGGAAAGRGAGRSVSRRRRRCRPPARRRREHGVGAQVRRLLRARARAGGQAASHGSLHVRPSRFRTPTCARSRSRRDRSSPQCVRARWLRRLDFPA